MIRIIGLLIIYISLYSTAYSQIEINRSINIYDVVVKTNKGTIKGTLKRATDSTIIIGQKRETKIVSIADINTLKIKFAQQKNYKFFKKIEQDGVDIIFNQPGNPQAVDNYGQPTFEPLENTENTLSDAAGRVLIGSAITTTAIAGNALTTLIYKPNIEVFKIKKDYKRYNKMKAEIQMYTEHLQLSPQYESILLQQLKDAMDKTKLNSQK